MLLDPADWLTLLERVAMAMAAGGAVGWNRQREGKPAGLRTHVLVAVGACLFTLVPMTASTGASAEAMSRVIQGVAVGIGFLGAGEIFHRGGQPPADHARVKGLTSAAAMWVTAAFGVVAGCGLWRLLVVATAVVLLVLTAVKTLERLFFPADHREDEPGGPRP